MAINFTKMHGLGNDFIVIDAVRQKINIATLKISELSRRDTGIGFDQCLIVERSVTDGVDFFYRIFNADGSEVGQCGNGARCLARFIQYYGLSAAASIIVATKSTQLRLHLQPDNNVRVDLPCPVFLPEFIPLIATQVAPTYALELQNHDVCNVHAVNVGNPHAVLLVSSILEAPVASLGAEISTHKCFPEHANVGFMQIDSLEHITLRVYERGCGETRACGSGAVAAVVVGRCFHNLDARVTVSLPGGDLIVEWPSLDSHIALIGPATFVYEGQICAS